MSLKTIALFRISLLKRGSTAAILAVFLVPIWTFSTQVYGKNRPVQKPAESKPADDPADAKTMHLAEPAAQMCAGGGGRFLIFHLKKAKQLVIVDLVQARIVKSIDLPGEDVCMAAGQDYLMVAFTGQNLLQRYSLKTFQREKTIPLTIDGAVRKLEMGSASDGPLMLWAAKAAEWMDPATLRPIHYDGGVGGGEFRCAADGQTFLGWAGGMSPLHFSLMHIENGKGTSQEAWSDGYNGAWLIPSADGSLIFRNGGVISTADLKPVSADSFKGSVLLPSDSPAFFLSIRPEDEPANAGGRRPPSRGKSQRCQVAICTTADCRSLYTVKNIEPMTSNMIFTQWGYCHGVPRIRYLPADNLLAVVPESDDAVIIRNFDLEASLKKSGEPFLVVVSKPPARAARGKEYVYAIHALSGSGGVKYHLESGPEGMTISDTGKVRWQVPSTASGNLPVVVSLSDSGEKEAFHSFSITVLGPGSSAGSGSQSHDLAQDIAKPERRPSGGVARTRPGNSGTDKGSERGSARSPGSSRPGTSSPSGGPVSPPVAASEDVVAVDANRVELPSADCAWVPGYGDHTMLVLSGNRLTILGPDGISIQKKVKLPKAYSHIAERADSYVALCVSPQAVEVLDKATLAVRKSLKLHCTQFTDLALNILPSRDGRRRGKPAEILGPIGGCQAAHRAVLARRQEPDLPHIDSRCALSAKGRLAAQLRRAWRHRGRWEETSRRRKTESAWPRQTCCSYQLRGPQRRHRQGHVDSGCRALAGLWIPWSSSRARICRGQVSSSAAEATSSRAPTAFLPTGR
jgi:hypothetical protein